jgi:hypothetical protein
VKAFSPLWHLKCKNYNYHLTAFEEKASDHLRSSDTYAYVVIVFIVAAGVYSNSLGGELMYDDIRMISFVGT